MAVDFSLLIFIHVYNFMYCHCHTLSYSPCVINMADSTKIWSFAFLQHLSDRQLDKNLTGRKCSVN